MAPRLRNTPLVLTVLSPLAEGADRLVAQEVLKLPGSMLEVILPMNKEEYTRDFSSPESIREFERLLSQAKSVRKISSQSNRPEAYGIAGRHVVEQCDVLIALWDGKPATGKGGTAEIVDHARKTGCPLIWIQTGTPEQVTYELGKGLSPRAFLDLDDYNSQQLDHIEFEKQGKMLLDFFMHEATNERLDCVRMQPTFEYIINNYVRADILALRYQRLYYRTESAMYSLALLAIIIASAQTLFLPQYPSILVSEVVLMLAVFAIFWTGQRRHWHSKWIDYRFLAERFRSALFLATANIDIATLRPPRHLSLAYSSRDWMVAAFSSFWSCRPHIGAMDSSSWNCVRRFLCKAWIEDQIRYHDANRERQHRRHRLIIIASYSLFGLTILAALLHIFEVGSHTIETTFAFMATVLPAIAASIAAIRTHRDYLRNSMRSAEMVHHLKEINDKMIKVEDYNGFLDLLRETDETMLHENEDWRIVVRFNTPEVPA